MKSKTVSNWQKRGLKRKKKPERLFKTVDKVLKQIFGEPATLFIYKHLEEKHSLKREDIANELEIFTEALEKYLGDSGALVVLSTLFNESSELKLRKVEEREFFEQLKELKRVSYR
jgi:hypothetical protein